MSQPMTLSPTALKAARVAWLESASDYTRLNTSISAAITAYLAQREKEGFVEVPLNLARRVTSIARRNEDAPEIHELSTLLTAAQNGGEPCK